MTSAKQTIQSRQDMSCELSLNLNDATNASRGYSAPEVLQIGRANEMLQGSGRHKNDDTGSRGFVVG